MKVGDRVKIVADKAKLDEICVSKYTIGMSGVIISIDGIRDLPYRVNIGTEERPDTWWFDECDLELISSDIRTFDSGATRDTDAGKLDFEGFLSPIVLERYAQYLNKHRTMKDGSLRDSDNWQGLFGDDHLDVCMKSACRHFIDVWKQHRGFEGQDELEDSICAVLFNMMAYLFKLEVDKNES